MRLTIAARKSDLARLQAYMVGDALQKNFSDLKITYKFSSSLGDQNQHDPLWKMPEQGVFTQDFIRDLKSGNADLVVHSWKDLPTKADEKTMLAATMPRADHRDLLLVTKEGAKRARVNKTLRLLSSSPRRTHNLGSFLPKAFPGGLENITFESVRGNIQTRINKLLQLSKEDKNDGLIVAKAAIDRLLTSGQFSRQAENEHSEDDFGPSAKTLRQAIDKCRWMVLPASSNPPAAAQGALAVEIMADRKDLVDMLATINCQATFEDVCAERSLLAFYGGGCHQKIGVWVKNLPAGKITSLRGQSESGETLQKFSMALNTPLPKNIDDGEIFSPAKYAKMFKRNSIEAKKNVLEKISGSNGVFLASTHVPDEYLGAINGQIVWTSGVASWFKFAKKDIWVNGVDDNLGSFEPRRADILLGERADWLTLSHDQSPAPDCIKTYSLIHDMNSLPLEDEKYFYWRSGSAFKRAFELDPEIIKGVHACGLGRTFDIIREELDKTAIGKEAKIFPFVSEKDWLDQISK